MLRKAVDLVLYLGGIVALVYAGIRLFEVDFAFALAVYSYAVSVVARGVRRPSRGDNVGRHIIALVSDLHVLSTVALAPPKVHLDDGGTYQASKAQRWLWQCWGEYWNRVDDVREEGDTLYHVFNGDMMDGDHHGTAQIVTRNPTDEISMALEVMDEPYSTSPDHVFIIRGTESHVGKSGCKEEGVAKALRNNGWPIEGDPDTGNMSWWQWRGDIGGLRISAAHHGRSGTRSYTRGSYGRLYAFDIWAEYAQRQHFIDKDEQPDVWESYRPPALAFRAHKHKFHDSGTHYPTRLLQTGAWQLMTGYAHKVATESMADIGGFIIVIEDGQYEVERVEFQPSRGHVWAG